MTYQPPKVPYLAAKHRGGAQTPRHIVMHCTVSPCVVGGAKSIAKFFARGPVVSSAHYTVDPAYIWQSVGDHRVAYHCGYNQDSIGIELCDPQSGSGKRWGDKNHKAMLARAARLVAQLCLAYDIPVRKVSVAELKQGKKGICGHVDMSYAFRKSTHVDPGTAFPWAEFMKLVREAVADQKRKAVPVSKTPNITAALVASVRLTSALEKISHPGLKDEVERALAAQRKLRDDLKSKEEK